ncbi:unnamed protein product, partial [Trypanosoma congolense IL3000]
MINPHRINVEYPFLHQLLLAEFDIDIGSCIRVRYPQDLTSYISQRDSAGVGDVDEAVSSQHKIIQEDDTVFANYMMPDGSEKHVVGRTVFIVSRPIPVVTASFSLYCFSLVESSSDAPDDSALGTSKNLNWVRDPLVDNPFIHEELLYKTQCGEATVHSACGAVILGPFSLSQVNLSTSLPASVAAFLRQLRIVIAEGDKFAAGGSLHLSESDLPSFREGNYAFATFNVDFVQHGFLATAEEMDKLMHVLDSSKEQQCREGQTKSQADISSSSITEVPPLYGLCAVVTRKDASVRRGGITKSVSLLGPVLAWLEPFFPVLAEAALQCCNIKGNTKETLEDQRELLKRCFGAVMHGMDALWRRRREIKCLLEDDVMQLYTEGPTSSSHVVLGVSPFVATHKLRIPISPDFSNFTFSSYGLAQLLEAFGMHFWVMVVAVVLEKRIVILSRQGFPNDVCEVALSLGIIGNILDPSFTARKVFPYTSVSGYALFSQVPGYIVGTLNPIFESQGSWWDVLCDVDKKQTALSAESEKDCLQMYAASLQRTKFAKAIVSLTVRMKLMQKPSSLRHIAIRLMLEENLYLLRMIPEICRGYERGAASCILKNFLSPILIQFRKHAHHTSLFDDMPRNMLHPDEDRMLLVSVASLRHACGCTEAELLQVLRCLVQQARSENGVLVLLRRMPLVLDGINPLVAQLLHASLRVRSATRELLLQLETSPVGRTALK